LTDHFSPNPCVSTSLDLDDRRDAVLVYEKMVERPACAAILRVRETSLTSDQQETPRRIRRVVTDKKARVTFKQGLEVILS
jgi:hypothetical protein